jgi:transposase
MAAQRKYPEELRERAVKMLSEVREREGRGHGELARVARQLDVHPEALRSWAASGKPCCRGSHRSTSLAGRASDRLAAAQTARAGTGRECAA